MNFSVLALAVLSVLLLASTAEAKPSFSFLKLNCENANAGKKCDTAGNVISAK
jgi:hypothetical protein